MIVPLNLPKAPLRLSRKDDEVFVWCEVRKKKLRCTPEEWVRQHVIHFLNKEHRVPFSLMSTEYRMNYNGREKRADIVVFSNEGSPRLVVECKAPDIKLNRETLFQIAQYKKELNANLLMLSNGLEHIYARVDNEGIQYLDSLILD